MSRNHHHRGGRGGAGGIRRQLEHALMEQSRQGSGGRRQAKKGGENTRAHVYSSVTYEKSLMPTVASFSKFMQSSHPEIRQVKDVQTEHMQEWLFAHRKDWGPETMKNRMSEIEKIMLMVNATYASAEVVTDGLIAPTSEKGMTPSVDATVSAAIRVHAISREDYGKLDAAVSGSTSAGRFGPRLGRAFGLRACEVVGLRAEEIDLENRVLNLGDYCKNGRRRRVPIRDRDLEWIAAVKAEIGSGRIVPISEDSYLRYLRRTFKAIGIDGRYHHEKQHAIRKLYASERMEELRGAAPANGLDDPKEREAWAIVRRELGHGNDLREDLYLVYVKDLVL